MFNELDKAIFVRIMNIVWGFKTQFIIVCLLALLYMLLFFFLPLLTKDLIDNGILKKNFKYSSFLIMLIFAISIFTFALSIIKEKARSKISQSMENKLYSDMYMAIVDVEMSFFNSKNTSEFITNVNNDISQIKSVTEESTFMAITHVFSFVSGCFGLFFIDFKMAFLVLLFIPIKIYTVSCFSARRKAICTHIINSGGKLASWLGDNIDGMREIRTHALKQTKLNELEIRVHNLTNPTRDLQILDNTNRSLDVFLMQFLDCTMYFFGAYYIIFGQLSIGSLFAFIAYSTQVMAPMGLILNFKYIFDGIIPSAKRFFKLIDECKIRKEKFGNKGVKSIRNIIFDNVSLKLGEQIILKNVSFCINKGEKIAVVGNNGVGKSTLFSLIEGFIQPDAGRIMVNDVQICDYNLANYRKLISSSSQDTHFFNTTIKNNILLYRNDSSNKMRLITTIMDFSNFSEAKLGSMGKRGGHLSGGQKQKISLARMLVGEYDLYLFDETFSHLDVTSISRMKDYIFNVLSCKIIIFIAHGDDMIHQFDKVIRLCGDGTVSIHCPKNNRFSSQN